MMIFLKGQFFLHKVHFEVYLDSVERDSGSVFGVDVKGEWWRRLVGSNSGGWKGGWWNRWEGSRSGVTAKRGKALAVRDGWLLYHTMQHHTLPYNTIPYHTIQYHTIPCNSCQGWPVMESGRSGMPGALSIVMQSGKGSWSTFECHCQSLTAKIIRFCLMTNIVICEYFASKRKHFIIKTIPQKINHLFKS